MTGTQSSGVVGCSVACLNHYGLCKAKRFTVASKRCQRLKYAKKQTETLRCSKGNKRIFVKVFKRLIEQKLNVPNLSIQLL